MTFIKRSRPAVLAACILSVYVGGPCGAEVDEQVPDYIDRPLRLPALGTHGECPVSTGRDNVVSLEHGYIFGAGGYFFGSGPVYLALSWAPRDRAEAWFELDPRSHWDGAYRLKTPWIMDPQYVGLALIRGKQLDSDTDSAVSFAENTQAQSLTMDMVLRSDTTGTLVPDSYQEAVESVWGFWPSHVVISGPGCYAIQIDTKDGSDIVVFEAKRRS